MTDTVLLVYLARDGLFMVAEYTGELGFWWTRSFLFSLLVADARVHTEWAAPF